MPNKLFLNKRDKNHMKPSPNESDPNNSRDVAELVTARWRRALVLVHCLATGLVMTLVDFTDHNNTYFMS